MLTRHALSRQLDAETVETFDWWIGKNWENWDLVGIVENFCEPDDDGKLVLGSAWYEMSCNEQYDIFKSHEYTNMSIFAEDGKSIYDGYDPDDAVEAINEWGAKQEWATDGEVLAVDPDDLYEQWKRSGWPLEIRY